MNLTDQQYVVEQEDLPLMLGETLPSAGVVDLLQTTVAH